MSLADKLQALVDGLEDTRQAIEGKGATLPAGSPLGDYPAAVESIEGGGGEPWVPAPGPGQLTSTSSMFQYGWPQFLTSVVLLDTSNVTNMNNMFNGCSLLVEVELTDCSKVTSATSMFGSTAANTQATSLERLILPGMTRGFNLINTNMGAPALNDFFHSLGTASGSQTINIRGAPGAATCDKSIATTKGWTITG